MLTAWPGLIALLAASLVVAMAILVVYTIRTLTRPPRRTYASALARSRPGDPSELPASPQGPWKWREWTFRSRGTELPVWDIEGFNPGGPTIVLSHGWGDSRVGALGRVQHLASLASRLIAWDMPGHGDAGGMCSLGTLEVADLVALLDHIRSAPTSPIVLYGWSLGSGVSISGAVESPARIAGVIAENSYRLAPTPARNVLANGHLPHRFNLPLALWALDRLGLAPGLLHESFDRALLAERLHVPLLVLHGELDGVCPLADGRDIAGAAGTGGGSLVVVLGGKHQGLWTDEAFVRVVVPACASFVNGLKPHRGTDMDARHPGLAR